MDGDLEEIDSGEDPQPLAEDSEPLPSTSYIPDTSLEGNVSVPIEVDPETYSIPETDFDVSDPSFLNLVSSTPKRFS